MDKVTMPTTGALKCNYDEFYLPPGRYDISEKFFERHKVYCQRCQTQFFNQGDVNNHNCRLEV